MVPGTIPNDNFAGNLLTVQTLQCYSETAASPNLLKKELRGRKEEAEARNMKQRGFEGRGEKVYFHRVWLMKKNQGKQQ